MIPVSGDFIQLKSRYLDIVTNQHQSNQKQWGGKNGKMLLSNLNIITLLPV